MKLVDLALQSVKILKDAGDEGIKSDVLAELIDTPKRRVYDVIAVLKALDLVETTRKFDGTTIVWIDRSKDFIPRQMHEDLKDRLAQESEERKQFQVQLAEIKEQLRITKLKLRRDAQSIESVNKTEFMTTQLRIRALSINGIKRVEHSGIEVLIETHEAGMIVDPSEVEVDENEILLKNLQRL